MQFIKSLRTYTMNTHSNNISLIHHFLDSKLHKTPYLTDDDPEATAEANIKPYLCKRVERG